MCVCMRIFFLGEEINIFVKEDSEKVWLETLEGGRTGESEDAIIERQRWRLTTPLSPRPANHGCRWCRGDTARRHSDSAGTNRSNRFPLSRPINGIPRPTRLRDSPRIYSILLLPIIQLWKNFPPNSTVYYSRLNRTSKRVSCEIRLFIFTNDIKIFIKKYIILFSIAKKRLNFQREILSREKDARFFLLANKIREVCRAPPTAKGGDPAKSVARSTTGEEWRLVDTPWGQGRGTGGGGGHRWRATLARGEGMRHSVEGMGWGE